MPKAVSSFELTLKSRSRHQTLTNWLYGELRSAILEGRLAPGARLPASRDFASQYELSRGTVVTVLERLQAEGYITSRVGFGTWVNRVEAPRPARQAGTTPTYIRRVISTYKRPQPWVDLAFVGGIRPFRIGVPAINEFPSEVWGRIAADRARHFRSWLKKEADDGVTVATFQAGFPAPVPVPIPSNGIIAATTPTLAAQQYFFIPKDYKNPYVESWNVAIQQALPYNMSLQIAYVANHGVDMGSNVDINNPSYYNGGNASKPEYNCVGCPTTGPNAVHRTASTQMIFRGFSSNYQSLQTQLNKRFSNGLSFTTAFTWGKGLNYMDGDDDGIKFFINPRRNYAPTDFDRALNYEQSFTYELPFGRGHSRMNTGLAAVALGGWKLSGIISAVSGKPFTASASGATLNTPGTAQTATLSGTYKVTHGIGSSSPWFDPTAFSQPAGCTVSPCQLGNTGRNQFRGPGYIQDNLSIFKSFPLFREASLETRFEAFQLSNTSQFDNPNAGNPTAGNFGTVTKTLGSGQGTVNGVGGGRSLQASARITF